MQTQVTVPPRAQSQVMATKRRSPEELESQVYANLRKAEELHAEKMAKSNQNFQNARITSCKNVLLKNGLAVCVAFPNPNQKPTDIGAKRSSEVASLSS